MDNISIKLPKILEVPADEGLFGFVDTILKSIGSAIESKFTFIRRTQVGFPTITSEGLSIFENFNTALGSDLKQRLLAICPDTGESDIQLETDYPELFGDVLQVLGKAPIIVHDDKMSRTFNYTDNTTSSIELTGENYSAERNVKCLVLRLINSQHTNQYNVIIPLEETFIGEVTIVYSPQNIKVDEGTDTYHITIENGCLFMTKRCENTPLYSYVPVTVIFDHMGSSECSAEDINGAFLYFVHEYMLGVRDMEYNLLFSTEGEEAIITSYFYIPEDESEIDITLGSCGDDLCGHFSLTEDEAREQYPQYFEPKAVGLEATKRNSIRVF